MSRLSISTLQNRIDLAALEHEYLLGLGGDKTRQEINRMDTVRKKLHRLRDEMLLAEIIAITDKYREPA